VNEHVFSKSFMGVNRTMHINTPLSKHDILFRADIPHEVKHASSRYCKIIISYMRTVPLLCINYSIIIEYMLLLNGTYEMM